MSNELTQLQTRPTTSVLAKYPYLWAATPAVALFGLSFALSGTPLPQPINAAADAGLAGGSAALSGDVVLPASETLIVSRQTAGGSVLLRGRMQPPAGATVVAPSGGQISHIAVRPGQPVQAGQQIVALSTGVVSQRANLAPIERGQSRAEQAQVAAVRRQREWQSRVRSADARLEQAQQRVQAAQERVAQARAVVQRLQNGEEISTNEVSTPAPAATTQRGQSASQNAAAREAAVRGSQKLEEQADAALRQSEEKKRAAAAAEASAKAKYKRWLAAQETADNIAVANASSTRSDTSPASAGESGADAPKPASDNSSKKRAAQDRANALKAESDDAQDRATSLRREAERASARAETLRGKANSAVRQAATTLENLRVFENDEEVARAPRVGKKESGPDKKLSVAEAVRMARAAMEESRDAIADAERIRREVASYERPVESTRAQFDAATERLNNVQERMWNTAQPLQPNLRAVSAKSSGVVLWVASLTREVRAGEAVAGIGRTDRMEVLLHDTSDAWKSVRPGNMILALVQNTPSQSTPNSASKAAAQSTAAQSATAPSTTDQAATAPEASPVLDASGRLNGVPTRARVLGVRPPQAPNQPAVLRVAIHNPRREAVLVAGSSAANNAQVSAGSNNQDYGFAGRTFAPGTPVVCSLVQPGQRTEITIPSAAIRRDDEGNQYVAVLAPVGESAEDFGASLCRVEWRRVQVGRGDGFQNLILSGLAVGDRIALRPEAIQNFVLTHGEQATIRVEQA